MKNNQLVRFVFDDNGKLKLEMTEKFFNFLQDTLPDAEIDDGVVQIDLGDLSKLEAPAGASAMTLFAIPDDPPC